MTNPERTKELLSFYVAKSDLKGIMIKLATCESGLKDICITDTNNKLSCGIFMFQRGTFQHFCPDLKWNNSVKDDIICAERIIKKGLMSNHWVNCSRTILK